MLTNDAILKCIINLYYFSYFIFSTPSPPSKSIIDFRPLNSTPLAIHSMEGEKKKTQPQTNTKSLSSLSELLHLILPGKRQCPKVMRDVAVRNVVWVERKILNLLKSSFSDSS